MIICFKINLAKWFKLFFGEIEVKTTLMICILFLASANYAQTKYSTYYEQRKSHFEKLPNDSSEIIFLGNSITDGCNWSELFNDLRIKNRGISADITQGILDRLNEITEAKPLKIFIMIGINDLAAGISVDQLVANYKKIIEKIKTDSKDTKIFIQSILPVNPDFPKFKNHTKKSAEILEVNDKLKLLAQDFKLVYIDLYSLFVINDNKLNPEYTNDGLHLTGSGYLVWKSAVQKYINH